MSTVVAVLHPGDMGGAVGACLTQRDRQVVWASGGRSKGTRTRAEAARLEDLETVARCAEAADIVLSICPPHGAIDLAREVAAHGFKGIYVDANAIAPETTREVGRIVERAGASFVDGGIIGPPPKGEGRSRLYLAGANAKPIADLFEGTALSAIVMDGPVGTASAIKVCYAAWNKGAIAMLGAVCALARHEGVDQALLKEWAQSQPELTKRMEMVTSSARKGWRWVGEMEEIAASFEAAGLPPGFYLAAAEINRDLESFKDAAKTPSMAEVTSALLRKE
jgi:3-hydroxyisobutyrate dehydrogenase-like beta-hydroxyacid dehydrogenase